MARLRSAAKLSATDDAYDLPQSSANERERGTSKRTTRRSHAVAPAEQQPTRRSRRGVSQSREEQPVSEQHEQPPPKRRRTQRHEPEVNEQEEAEQHTDDHVEGEEGDEGDSRPSDAFLRSINEGIRGDVLPTKRRNQGSIQEPQPQEPPPEVEPEPEQQEEVPERRHTSHNTRASGRKTNDQRTLVVESSTGLIELAPESASIALPRRHSTDEQEEDARSASSGLFVPSTQGEDEESSQAAGNDVDGTNFRGPETEGDHDPAQAAMSNAGNVVSDQEDEDDAALSAYHSNPTYLDLLGRSCSQLRQTSRPVQAGKLAYLEKTISSKAWTGLKTNCRQILLKQANETEDRWLKRLKKRGLLRWASGKSLLEAVDTLHEILQDAPKMPHADEQNSYFSDVRNDLKTALARIESLACRLGRVLWSAKTASAAEATTTAFIPLLVMALQESFRLGGAFGDDGEFETVSTGTFTDVSLGIMRHLVQVILRLCEALQEYRLKVDEEHKPLHRLYDQLVSFEGNIDGGLRIIKSRDPERLRLAKQQDENIERLRAMEEQKRLEECELRMSAFTASTQRMRGSLPLSQFATQQPQSTPRQLIRSPAQYLRSTPQQAFRSSNIPTTAVPEFNEEDSRNDSGDYDREIAEQLQRDRQERDQEAARQERIASLKKQDRLAQEMREAQARARRETMNKRMAAFIASSQAMRA